MTAGKTETEPRMNESLMEEIYPLSRMNVTSMVFNLIREEKALYRPVKGNALLGSTDEELRSIFLKTLANDLGITSETDGVRRASWDLILRLTDGVNWEEIRALFAEE